MKNTYINKEHLTLTLLNSAANGKMGWHHTDR
jgi:hypothetical protein